jgi:hypothetical protein
MQEDEVLFCRTMHGVMSTSGPCEFLTFPGHWTRGDSFQSYPASAFLPDEHDAQKTSSTCASGIGARSGVPMAGKRVSQRERAFDLVADRHRVPTCFLETDEDDRKTVVVCVVSDGRAKINARTLSVLAAMGVYQDGVAKNVVAGKPVTAHIYEYTTQSEFSCCCCCCYCF